MIPPMYKLSPSPVKVTLAELTTFSIMQPSPMSASQYPIMLPIIMFDVISCPICFTKQDESRTMFFTIKPSEKPNRPTSLSDDSIARLLIVCPCPSNVPEKPYL